MEVCDLPTFPELFSRRAKTRCYIFPVMFFLSHHMSSAVLVVSGVYIKINSETWYRPYGLSEALALVLTQKDPLSFGNIETTLQEAKRSLCCFNF